jgi:hypothetical protein
MSLLSYQNLKRKLILRIEKILLFPYCSRVELQITVLVNTTPKMEFFVKFFLKSHDLFTVRKPDFINALSTFKIKKKEFLTDNFNRIIN